MGVFCVAFKKPWPRYYEIALYLDSENRRYNFNWKKMTISTDIINIVRGKMFKNQSYRALCDTILKFDMVLGYAIGITKTLATSWHVPLVASSRKIPDGRHEYHNFPYLRFK